MRSSSMLIIFVPGILYSVVGTGSSGILWSTFYVRRVDIPGTLRISMPVGGFRDSYDKQIRDLATNLEGARKRIVGGRPAVEGELPYQVSLMRSYNYQHFCGGIIITGAHVLTAAHCVVYNNGKVTPFEMVVVLAGQLNLLVTQQSSIFNITKISPHEKYNIVTLENDIAVILLNADFPTDQSQISRIAMRQHSIASGKCLVSGWGIKDLEVQEISQELLVAQVDIVPFEKCKEMYKGSTEVVAHGIICAGHMNGSSDACMGDSGGPLNCNGLLTGIVSNGVECGSSQYPGLYIDIPQYIPWIMENIKTDEHTSTTSLPVGGAIRSTFISEPLILLYIIVFYIAKNCLIDVDGHQ